MIDGLKNKIHHCDYLELLRQIPDESVDLVVTDPPYGIDFQSHRRKEKHDVLKGDGGEFSYAPLAREVLRILKPDTAAFFFTRWDVYPDHFRDVKSAGFEMKPTNILQKAAALGDLEGSFAPNYEWCIHGTKGRFKFRETNLLRYKLNGRKLYGADADDYKTRFPAAWFGDAFPMASEPASFQKKYKHPTPKNQVMITWLIQLASDKGGLVVDPFSGSGTTAAACILTGRDFIVGEIDQTFVETGRRRISRSHIGGFF